jgi:hypothetical protein
VIDLHREGAASDQIDALREGIGIVEIERFRIATAYRIEKDPRLQPEPSLPNSVRSGTR